jgi:hypothetical protein
MFERQAPNCTSAGHCPIQRRFITNHDQPAEPGNIVNQARNFSVFAGPEEPPSGIVQTREPLAGNVQIAIAGEETIAHSLEVFRIGRV